MRLNVQPVYDKLKTGQKRKYRKDQKEADHMKRVKTVVLCLGAGIAFLVQLFRGLVPTAAPGEIPTGAMNDPAAVCFSAALSAFVVWLALEIVFRLAEKWREGRK